MATFWEETAHSFNRMFALLLLCLFFLIFVVSHFGFEGGTVVLIAPDPVIAFLWRDSLK